MTNEEKQRMKNMGELQFWNENLVYYRNKVEKAKSQEEYRENLEMLRTCRTAKRRAEKLILAVLLLCILFIVGCETVSGFGRDVTNLSDGWMEKQARNRQIKNTR